MLDIIKPIPVSQSFFEAMAVLASGGKVRNKSWSKDALFVELLPLTFPVAIFHKKVAEINGQPVIEKIGWSPSLADFTAQWEVVEKAKEPIEDTFGYAVLQLFEKDWLELKHRNWSGSKVLMIEEKEITTFHEFSENQEDRLQKIKFHALYLYDKDTGKMYPYLPTMPDILRKGWVIIEEE